MSSDPRLAALPAVVALADQMADNFGDALPWEPHHGPTSADLARAFRDQLSDLSRPASRDAVARLVAEAVGMACGATAPRLVKDGAGWAMTADYATGMKVSSTVYFSEPNGLGASVNIPGLLNAADPSEALTLIALSVLT